ncbi:MAG: DUF4185 domain-containing protein [Actinomycetota bacterium]
MPAAVLMAMTFSCCVSRSGASLPATSAASRATTYVAGSSRKDCLLTGAYGESQRPTTETSFGLISADSGYSFTGTTPKGQGLWFLFGDSRATARFPNPPNPPKPSKANQHDNLSNRFSPNPAFGNANANPALNDPIGYSTTPVRRCPVLRFIPQPAGPPVGHPPAGLLPAPAPGAYTNALITVPPSVASSIAPIDQRTNEAPFSGITGPDGRVYAIFNTDNPECKIGSPCTKVSATNFGHGTRSVMAKLTDVGTLTFQALYNFSTPPSGKQYDSGAKFVLTSMAEAPDGNVYIYGTEGGSAIFRMSPVFLARLPATNLATGVGLQYFNGRSFVPGESNATPLFNDASFTLDKKECISLLGVEFNPFIRRWVMIYDCHFHDPDPTNPKKEPHPSGIWMRTALNPWGPWDAPQTILNASRDGAGPAGRKCKKPSWAPPCIKLGKATKGGPGDTYGPHFLPGWTTGTTTTTKQGLLTKTVVTSTFYYTVDTFNPYGQVIVQSTITMTTITQTSGCTPPRSGCT